MKIPFIKNKMALLAMLFLLFAVIIIPGCGDTTKKRDCENAPDLSQITLLPESQTYDTGGTGAVFNIPLDWTVRVAYPDNTPMPYACINISGPLAVPNGYNIYQFQFYPSWVSPNLPVNSGFSAKTDKNGEFSFSTLITAPSPTFKDAVYVQSGSNKGSAEMEIK